MSTATMVGHEADCLFGYVWLAEADLCPVCGKCGDCCQAGGCQA